MPGRDPQTGKFVSGTAGYDDVESVTDVRHLSVAASNNDGTTGQNGGQSTGFEGVELYSLDSALDRNEEAELIGAWHRLEVFINSTTTADNTFHASVEISSSPSNLTVRPPLAFNEIEDTGWLAGDSNQVINQSGSAAEDTQAVVGPPLSATAIGQFTDTVNGTGGGGHVGVDEWDGVPADPDFYPRDRVFLNGVLTQWNLANAASHANLTYHHVYGVKS